MKLFRIFLVAVASVALITAGCSRSTSPADQDSGGPSTPSTEPSTSEGEASGSSGNDASSSSGGPASSEEAAAQFQNINAQEASKLVEKNSELVVLDVRTPQEFQEGHIAGATNIDFHASDFQKQLGQLDKDKPYLVHCASGGRSSKTRERMKSLDFTRIYHLDGGFNAWKEAGNPVEQ